MKIKKCLTKMTCKTLKITFIIFCIGLAVFFAGRPLFESWVFSSYEGKIISLLDETEKSDLISLPEEGLISMHFTLGLEIRDSVSWNNYDVIFLLTMYSKGIYHHDDIAYELTKRVWKKLYEALTPEKRDVVDGIRKRKAIKNDELMLATKQCRSYFSQALKKEGSCLKSGKEGDFGFEKLVISKFGKIIEYQASSGKASDCAQEIINRHQFTPFEVNESIILDFDCVAEGLGSYR